MKHACALLFLLAACRSEPAVTNAPPIDTREPLSIRYVGAPELVVREQPSADAAELATYQNGEAISVLAEKGEWVEVRTGERAGWALAGELTDAKGAAEQEDNPQVKFRVIPMPISAPSAKGEIYLEADVNSEGEVISVRTIANTTGSQALVSQNTDSLKAARFYPIVQNGERRPFKYYHRVTY
jgi:uncharacterized protein YgiM (DUF1202 family)